MMPLPSSLFAQLVWWELVRLTRRKQFTRLCILFLYLLFLTCVLFVVWWSSSVSSSHFLLSLAETDSPRKEVADPHGLAHFAELLSLVLLEVQLLFVAIISPPYAAIAITEEKERNTLALLLTTELTDGEIVWGKTIARAMAVFAAVAIGLPLIVSAAIIGGVSWQSITAGYALTAGTTFLSAAFGASAGCRSPDTRSSLLRAYALTGIFILLLPELVRLSAFDMLAFQYGFKPLLGLQFESPGLCAAAGFLYAITQAAIGTAVMIRACQHFRIQEPGAGPSAPTAYPEPPRGRPTPIVFTFLTQEPRPLPPLDAAHPVLWKERHAARGGFAYATPARWLGGVVVLIAVGAFVFGAWQLLSRAVAGLNPDEARYFTQQGVEPHNGGVWLMAAGVLTSGLFLIPLLSGIAGCVAGERQRMTLELLLMTTLPRRTILWSKVQAHLERWLGFGVASIAAIGCGFGASGGMKIGLAAMASLAAGFWFVMVFGAWLSVRCASPGRAFWLCLPSLSGVIALPLVAWSFTNWTDTSRILNGLALTAAALVVAGCLLWWRAVENLNRCE